MAGLFSEGGRAGRAEVKRRRDARGGAELFHLFDDKHFDGHIGGNKFEAKLVVEGLL